MPLINGAHYAANNPLTYADREALVGERVTFMGPPTLVHGPAPIGVEGNGATFSEPGLYVLALPDCPTFRVLVFCAGAVDMVPTYQRSGRSSPRSEAERRLVLRAIALWHEGADGSAEQTRTLASDGRYGA